MSSSARPLYINPSTKSYKIRHSNSFDRHAIRKFHSSLPSYSKSPLTTLPEVAKSLGVKALFIKDESCRFGLPSFKILGASWGAFRGICEYLKLSEATELKQVAEAARNEGIVLFAATDGNHGRAVARMAATLGLRAEIYIPAMLDSHTKALIANESGCTVFPIDGDYDTTVETAYTRADAHPTGLLIQDTAFTNYEQIPAWIVDGYSTMLEEIMSQCALLSLQPTHIVTPVGVGSLAHAVVSHCKLAGNDPPISVITVEPETAACLHTSLKAGEIVPLHTTGTIMNGLDCGTVSLTAWPALRAGVDASTIISDLESHRAVEYLASQGVSVGPCGAAGLAAIQSIANTDCDSVGLGTETVIVILGTEGSRPYAVPDCMN